MDYCGPIGLPHSRFLSWSDEDQDKALAWSERKNSQCPGCGTIPGETMRNGKPMEPLPYVVDSYFCPVCQIKDEAEEASREDGRKHLHHFVRRRDERDEDLP